MTGMVVARCGVAGWRIGALVESDDEAEDELPPPPKSSFSKLPLELLTK